jgi:hypothetical protein
MLKAAGVSLAVLLLGACTTVPLGPSVMVLPGTGKPFEQFQSDDAVCRQWAFGRTGTTPQHAAGTSTASGAAIGTVLGAGLGAAIGAAAGNPGIGAAVGAGGGLLTGTAVGAGAGGSVSYEVQRRYDNAYQQCMYAKGNQIPMAAGAARKATYETPPPPPAGAAPPPDAAAPPAGTPPPPVGSPR